MLKKAVSLLLILLTLTACASNPVPEDNESVEATFEQDYSYLESIVTYLLSLEEDRVRIHCNPVKILGEYGESMEFSDPQIEQIVHELAKKGYNYITKSYDIVVFDVWRKPIYGEFAAGFGYSDDGMVDAYAVSFLTYQEPLSTEHWCYYEADYNEWRVRHTAK